MSLQYTKLNVGECTLCVCMCMHTCLGAHVCTCHNCMWRSKVNIRGVFLNCFFFLLVLVPQLRLLLLAGKLHRMGNRKIQKMGLSLNLELPILATHPHRHLVLGSQTSAASLDFHVGAEGPHSCATGTSLRAGSPPSGEDQLIGMPPSHV